MRVAPQPTAMAMSMSGLFLAVAADNQYIHIFDIKSGRQVASYHGHSAPVLDVQWSPDGKQVCARMCTGARGAWLTRTAHAANLGGRGLRHLRVELLRCFVVDMRGSWAYTGFATHMHGGSHTLLYMRGTCIHVAPLSRIVRKSGEYDPASSTGARLPLQPDVVHTSRHPLAFRAAVGLATGGAAAAHPDAAFQCRPDRSSGIDRALLRTRPSSQLLV